MDKESEELKRGEPWCCYVLPSLTRYPPPPYACPMRPDPTPIPPSKEKKGKPPNRSHRIIANLPPLALRPDNSPKKKSHRLSSRINTSSPLPPVLLSRANLSLLACAAACSPTRYGSSRRRVRSRALSSSTMRSSSMMRRASWMWWRWRVSWWAAAERRRATRAVGEEMVDHEGMRKCPRVGIVGMWWLRRGPEGTGGRPGVGGELCGEEGRREGRRVEGRVEGGSPRGEYGGRGSGLRMVEW